MCPAYFVSPSPAVVMDGQVPRNVGGRLFAQALGRALFRELRQERGLSYTATAAYGTDGRARATVTAVVDAEPHKLDHAVDGLLTEVRRLADTDLAEAELATIRTREIEALDF